MSFDPTVIYELVHAALTPSDDPTHESQIVSVHFFDVRVNKNGAEAIRSKLVEALNEWPETDQFGNTPGRLQDGLSYISIGSAVGSQELALQLMGVGEVCGLWAVITPATLRIEGAEAEDLAGRGFVMCDGYRP